MRWFQPESGDRPEDAAKGDYGRVVAVGGSRDFPNTPAIVSKASIKAGADLAVINAPERSADSSASFALDIISRPLDGERLLPGHVDRIRQSLADDSILVVGNGMGRSEASLQAVQQLVQETSVPLVLDADALYTELRSMQFTDRDVVLTPHRGEFEHIYEEPGESLAVRKQQVTKAARVLDATVVMKAPVDVVSNGAETAVNKTGNAFMTKGGTGDVLAGVAGALLARYEPLRAGFIAAHVTGMAGDRAADTLKQSLAVEDVLEKLPSAFSAMRDAAQD